MILTQTLPKSQHSKIKILLKCDKCNNDFLRRYDIYKKINNMDLCKSCVYKELGIKRRGKYFLSKETTEKNRLKRIEINKIKYPKLTLNCQYCSKEFTVNYSRRNKAKYCSKKCQLLGYPTNKGRDSRKIQKCSICDKEFKSYAIQQTCSKNCYSKYMSNFRIGENNPNFIKREELEKSKCPNCGIIFSYTRNNLHKGQFRLFCSLKCSKEMASNKKIDNPEQYIINSNNYNKFIEYVSNPYPNIWKNKFKDKIKSRDNYCCQLCGNEKKLEIHHIDYNKQNCNEENLITLCKKCHNITNHNRQFWTQVFIGLNSNSKIVKKGWGLEIHLINNEQYCLKYLIFFKGKKFSLHKHFIKKELWLCTWGAFECLIKDNDREEYFIFRVGDKIELNPGIEHQLKALTNCIITEVSTTDYPEDSVRIEKGD